MENKHLTALWALGRIRTHISPAARCLRNWGLYPVELQEQNLLNENARDRIRTCMTLRSGESNSPAYTNSATRAYSASDPTAGAELFFSSSGGYHLLPRCKILPRFFNLDRAVRHVRSIAFRSAPGTLATTERTI